MLLLQRAWRARIRLHRSAGRLVHWTRPASVALSAVHGFTSCRRALSGVEDPSTAVLLMLGLYLIALLIGLPNGCCECRLDISLERRVLCFRVLGLRRDVAPPDSPLLNKERAMCRALRSRAQSCGSARLPVCMCALRFDRLAQMCKFALRLSLICCLKRRKLLIQPRKCIDVLEMVERRRG